MLAGLCWPLRCYAPVTTRHEHIPVGSLMPSMASNGRIRGMPTQRQKLRAAEGLTSGNCGVCWRAVVQGRADRRVAMDGDRELTGMYLQRVGTALHPSTT